MDSVNQARSQAWSLWTKLAAPALLRSPVLGISAVLAISTPIAAVARTLPRAQEMVSAEPTHRQMRVLHSYERYLARMKAQSLKATGPSGSPTGRSASPINGAAPGRVRTTAPAW